MSDRPHPNHRPVSRRDFLKAGVVAAAALAGNRVLDALGAGPGTGIAYAQQEGGTPPDRERYKQALDERFNVNGEQDPIALRFIEKGIQELKTQSGLDMAGDGTFRTPTPRMLADAVYFKLTDWRLQNGEFDPQVVADHLVSQWGPENLGPGQQEGTTFFIKVADPSTGNETYVMNVDQWKNALSTMPSMTIPYEVLNAAKTPAQAANPAENIPAAAQPDAFATQYSGLRNESLTQAYAPNETPIPTPVATRTPAEIAEQASFDKMLGGCLFFLGLGGLAALLGIPAAFALRGGGEGGGSPLGKIRGNRARGPISNASLKAIDEVQKDIRDGKYG